MDLEYLTPEVKSMLENLGLGAIRSQLDQNFCLIDNDSLNKRVEKKRKTKGKAKTPYSSTKVKARNFLSNISYRRLKENDAFNISLLTVFHFLYKILTCSFWKGSLMVLKIENWLICCGNNVYQMNCIHSLD